MTHRAQTKGRPQGSAAPAPAHAASPRTQRRRPPPHTIATVALIAALIYLVAVSTVFKLTSGEHAPAVAAIVDQLSLTQPNPGFADRAAHTLMEAGYSVDYYPGEEITVDFYRNLPLGDYKLILLRNHSSVAQQTGGVGLFTSEPYSETRYVEEQRAGHFGRAHYYDGGAYYFAVHPKFIESSAGGRFDDTLVIMMGCQGLLKSNMAEALVDKGALAVIGWDGLVSAAHSDAATELLVRHLLADELTVGEAIAETMSEVGPDPAYGSSLLFYPPESAADLQEASLAR